MTMVCYNRPNRTKARPFTARDVARIAKYAVDDGAEVRDLIVKVAKALGLAFVLCILARALNAVLVIARLFAKIGGAAAVASLIERLIGLLSGGLIRKIPRINAITILLVILLESFKEVVDAIAVMVDDISVIESASEFLNDLCDRVKLNG